LCPALWIYPTESIARMVMTVGTPSLVLSTFSRTDLAWWR